MKKKEAAQRLLQAMTEIDDRYIEEAMPKEIVDVSKAESSTAHRKHPDAVAESSTVTSGEEERASKVLYMKAKRRWQPIGIVAAAAVLVLGFGAYHMIESHTAAQTPAMLSETGAPAMAKAKAFSEDSGAGPDMQIANPWSDFDKLSDAEADAGFQITIPQRYAGFDQLLYRSMHMDMLEVIYQNAEGQEGFRIRKAHESGDISGDYTNYTTEATQEIDGRTVQLRGNGEDIFVATWSVENYSYAICVAQDQHFTIEDLQALIKAMDPV